MDTKQCPRWKGRRGGAGGGGGGGGNYIRKIGASNVHCIEAELDLFFFLPH